MSDVIRLCFSAGAMLKFLLVVVMNLLVRNVSIWGALVLFYLGSCVSFVRLVL